MGKPQARQIVAQTAVHRITRLQQELEDAYENGLVDVVNSIFKIAQDHGAEGIYPDPDDFYGISVTSVVTKEGSFD